MCGMVTWLLRTAKAPNERDPDLGKLPTSVRVAGRSLREHRPERQRSAERWSWRSDQLQRNDEWMGAMRTLHYVGVALVD